MGAILQEKPQKTSEFQPQNRTAILENNAEEFIKQRNRLIRAGGNLVWRNSFSPDDKPIRELVGECPDSTINSDFNRAAKHMDTILAELVVLETGTPASKEVEEFALTVATHGSSS